MKTHLFRAIIVGLVCASAHPAVASEPAVEAMPTKLETQLALSAAPPRVRACARARVREKATVYLLVPDKGYLLARQGTNGVTCIVQRTEWQMGEFRDDIYIPICYDAAGTRTYLKVIMDTAAMRAKGISPAALKAEMQERYREKTYAAPEKAGLSYMVAPLMRAVGPPDLKVHTMAMPHLMFYGPNLTNEDIGAAS